MRRRNDGAGVSPQEEFGDVCFHALGIIDQNREYLHSEAKILFSRKKI